MAAETIVAPCELLDCSSWLQCLFPCFNLALVGSCLGLSTKVGGNIQGEVDNGLCLLKSEKFTVSQLELRWKGRYWDFTDILSILHPTSRKQLLTVPHSREWAMKPHITPAVPHAAWLKLTLSEVNASILTDSHSSLTSPGLILSLGPRPSVNTPADVNQWFSNIYKPKSSFVFPFAPSFAAPWSDLFSVTSLFPYRS